MFKLGQTQAEKRLLEVQEDHTRDIAILIASNEELKKETRECRKDREELRVMQAKNETQIEALNAKLAHYIEKHAGDIHG
jgi:site-specific DNA-adenine methylase